MLIKSQQKPKLTKLVRYRLANYYMQVL